MIKLEEQENARHALLVALERYNLVSMKLERHARYADAGIEPSWEQYFTLCARGAEACARLAEIAQQESDRLSIEAVESCLETE